MEWHWERYKVSAMQNKYTARHIISVPAGNGQAGRAPDSRETIPSSSPDRSHFNYYNYISFLFWDFENKSRVAYASFKHLA